MARHRNAAALALADGDPPTELYRPQQLEVRTRRAPESPLWARFCVGAGGLLIIIAILGYLVAGR